MSKREEINELLRKAGGQGFRYRIDGAGHWEVVAPPGRSGPRGTSTRIASTPRSDSGVNTARQRLVGIGFTAAKPPKKKSRDTNETGSPTLVSYEATRTEEGNTVPRLGEIARVSGGQLSADQKQDQAHRRHLIPAKQILEDLPLAAWIVWQHVQDELRANHGQERELGGFQGYLWTGSRNRMIQRIWPSLDPVDYSVTPAAMPPETRALCRYLTGSKNMAVLAGGSPTRLTRWWISADWREVDPGRIGDDAHGNWWERKVTPEEAGENREPAPVTVTKMATAGVADLKVPVVYRCDACAFESERARSLGTHKARLGSNPHPTERYPCPIDGCLEVRADIDGHGNHVSKDHRNLGLQTCRQPRCGEVLVSRGARIHHQMIAHPGSFGRKYDLVEVTDSADVSDATVADTKVTEPVTSPTVNGPVTGLLSTLTVTAPASPGEVSDPLAYLQNLLAEVSTLREQAAAVPGLENRLTELEAAWVKLTADNTRLKTENEELTDRYEQVATWLKQYPFKRGADGSPRLTSLEK